jgi:hypothetical protein
MKFYVFMKEVYGSKSGKECCSGGANRVKLKGCML